MGKLVRQVSVCAAALALCACTNNPPPAEPKKPPPPVEEAKIPDGSLDRATLEVVLRQGPPWLLERVPVEEVMEGTKFVGWRVQELPLDWRDMAIQPGDVVVAVNAMPLETPNDFWAAWTSLSVASELKIAYLREGEARELSIPIYGSPSPELASDLQKRPEKAPPASGLSDDPMVPTNQQYTPAAPKKTIEIESQEKPITDTTTDWSDHPF